MAQVKVAAIYCRKSTDDDRDDGDQFKSVAIQEQACRDFAKKKGWRVGDDLVFVDDGISGADFATREGLFDLIAAADEYDVLIMTERSRLGREQQLFAHTVRKIQEQDVVIWYANEGTEESGSDTAWGKFEKSIHGFIAEMERELSVARSRRAADSRAREGKSTGGPAPYGYKNVKVYNDRGEHIYTDVLIEEEEAEAIRTIFQMFADGKNRGEIEDACNGKNVQFLKDYFGGGRPKNRGKSGSNRWRKAGIRDRLKNFRYKGVYEYNKEMTVYDSKGKRKRVKRPKDQWKYYEVPQWRIVSDDLWDAAKARFGTSKRDASGKSVVRTRYMLSGLLQCASCGGRLNHHVRTKDGKRYFKCEVARAKGDAPCHDTSAFYSDILEPMILDAFKHDYLSETAINAGIDDLEARFNSLLEGKNLKSELENVEEDIAAKTAAKQRLLDRFIYDDDPDIADRIDALKSDIRELSRRRDALQQAEIEALDPDELKTHAATEASHLRELLDESPDKANQVLRSLIRDPYDPSKLGRLRPRKLEQGNYALEGFISLEPLFRRDQLRRIVVSRVPKEIRHSGPGPGPAWVAGDEDNYAFQDEFTGRTVVGRNPSEPAAPGRGNENVDPADLEPWAGGALDPDDPESAELASKWWAPGESNPEPAD